MNDPRRLISWLLLGLLTAVGVGGAILGIALAPRNVPLHEAATNTKAAANYSEVATEQTTRGSQTDYLVYQAPDRLGGYIQSGNQRTYIYIIGSVQYQSVSVKANASTQHLVFYRQAAQPVTVDDPAYNYLGFVDHATHVTQDGSTYTFVLHQGTQTGTFVYTVNGKYVSSFALTVPGASVHLVISQVGTSPPVKLPAGAKVIGIPASSGTGAAG
jgi:hypothetical protein